MNWLSDRWGRGPSIKGLVSSVKGTGHTLGEIASNPLVQGLTEAALIATGVGAPAAAAIMAAEKGGGALLKPGGNIGQGLVGGAEGAAAGFAGAKLGPAIKSGLGAITGGGSAAPDAIGGSGGAPAVDAGGGIGGAIKAALGKVGNLGSTVLGDLTGGGNPSTGGGTLLDKLLLAASVADSAASRQRATSLQKTGLNYATDAYNALAPLRAKGIAQMGSASAPDLSSIFADPANPYARKAPRPQIGAAVPMTAPTTAGVA